MRFVLGRVLQGLITIATILVIVFFALRVVGNPVDVLLPVSADEEARQALTRQLGLDRPIPVQFADFVADAVQLDFGESYTRHAPALPIVLSRFGKTVQLVGISLLLAAVFGIGIGAVAALRPDGFFDRLSARLSVVSVSVPQFWLGLVLILLFAVALSALPSSGSGGFRHLVLPVLTLAIPPTGRFAVVARRALRDELEEDYIRLDRARGLPEWRVMKHAVRATTVTMWSVIGYELVYTLAGHSIVVETVFAWPGIGSLVTEALNARDFTLIQALIGFIALLVVGLNLLLDVFYFAVDPRIAHGDAGS